MYAELKKASADGEIAISTLPKPIQPSLRVFDLDGNGTLSPLELSRGAELYADSKNQVKRLTRWDPNHTPHTTNVYRLNDSVRSVLYK